MIDFAEMAEDFRGLTGHITGPGLRKFSRKAMARPLATLYRLIRQGYFASRGDAGEENVFDGRSFRLIRMGEIRLIENIRRNSSSLVR
jgi:hypothetical protein